MTRLHRPGGGISRRTFLYSSAAGTFVASNADFLALGDPMPTPIDDIWLEKENLKFDDILTAVRVDDFVSLQIGLVNATARKAISHRDSTEPLERDVARIVRCGDGPAAIVLIFGPQHIAERAYLLQGLNEKPITYPPDAPPSGIYNPGDSIISGSSRLAFRIREYQLATDHNYGIPLALDRIFDLCRTVQLSLPAFATKARPEDFDRAETLIEYPTRLFLIPRTSEVTLDPYVNDRGSAERNLSKFVVLPATPPERRSVLFGVNLTRNSARSLAALAQRSDTTGDIYDSTQVLLRQTRRQIIIDDTATNPPAKGAALAANLLQLTSLGINADVIFVRQPGTGPNNSPFVRWHQTTTNGRDSFIELVFAGILMPFGHRAELILSTKRQPYALGGDWFGALIETTTIRLVDQYCNLSTATPDYTANAKRKAQRATASRGAAATSVKVQPHVSPPIRLPSNTDQLTIAVDPTPVAGTNFVRAFVPTGLDGQPITWRLTPTSHVGETPETNVPLVFCFNDGSLNTVGAISALQNSINNFFEQPLVVSPAAPLPADKPFVANSPVSAGDILTRAVIDPDSGMNATLKAGSKRYYKANFNGTLPATITAALQSGLLTQLASFGDFAFLGQSFTFAEPGTSVDKLAFQAKNALRTLSARYSVDIDYDVTSCVFDVIPALVSATVVLPATQAVGAIDDAANAATISLIQGYRDNLQPVYEQLQQAAGKVTDVYAAVEDALVDFNRDSGTMQAGVAAMRAQLGALSSQYGALLGTAQQAGNQLLNAAAVSLQSALAGDYAQSLNDARLFGLVKLSDLLDQLEKVDPKQVVSDFTHDAFPKLPVTVDPDGTIHVRYNYAQSLGSGEPGVVEPIPAGGNITLTYTATASLSPSGNSQRSLSMQLGAISLPFPPKMDSILDKFQNLITLNFSGVSVETNGGSLSVHPSFAGATLNAGVLAFLMPFAEYFESGNLFDIVLNALDISAVLSLNLPDIDLGGFSLDNFDFNLSGVLPLDADKSPSLTFDLASRLMPFTALLDFLGGGGWFHLGFSIENILPTVASPKLDATATLEISGGINVSAGLDIDLADIVKGWVAIDAGAFFDLEIGGANPHLTFGGSVVISGGVEAFDLISASMYVSIEAAYTSPPGDLFGTAEYHVEVHLLFFSASFSTSVDFRCPLGPGHDTAGANMALTSPIRTAWDDHIERRRMIA